MQKLCLIVLACLSAWVPDVHAQKTIGMDVQEGDRYRSFGKLDSALNGYRKMYRYDSSYSENIYRMATAFSLLRQFDSCFLYLYKANNIRPTDDALSDPDLYPARSDKRWPDFEKQLTAILLKKDTTLKNIDYARQLWRLRAGDQAYYYDLKIAGDALGQTSSTVYALWDLKEKINTQNRQELEVLLNKNGWPKISEVGSTAASAAFLVIQHYDLEHQKKYLPMLLKLCEEKEASWQSYALMYDRIQTDEGKPQRYGSQVNYNKQTQKYELFPLEDENQVDEWRKAAGLGPLSDYLAHWDIKFEPKRK